MKEMVCIKQGNWVINYGFRSGQISSANNPKFNELVHVRQCHVKRTNWFVYEYPISEDGLPQSFNKKWFAEVLPSESLTALLEETKTVEI